MASLPIWTHSHAKWHARFILGNTAQTRCCDRATSPSLSSTPIARQGAREPAPAREGTPLTSPSTHACPTDRRCYEARQIDQRPSFWLQFPPTPAPPPPARGHQPPIRPRHLPGKNGHEPKCLSPGSIVVITRKGAVRLGRTPP